MNTQQRIYAAVITALFFLSSCSSVIVFSPKHICIHGNSNQGTEIKGADLEGQLDQKADGQIALPLVP